MHFRFTHWSSDSFHCHNSIVSHSLIKIIFTIQHSRSVNLPLLRKVDLQHNWVTLCNATIDLFLPIIGPQTLALKMRETRVSLESVWEHSVRPVEEGSKRPSKSLKGSKLRRTSNLTFLKTGLKLHTKKQCLRLSLRTIEYATNTYKRYFYTFEINQSTFTYGEGKKERPDFYGMFSQSLPISAAFILKMKLPQCNAIGVRTPPDFISSYL